MALRILQLKRRKELLEQQRDELSKLDGSFSLRQEELEKAVEEATTQEDHDLVGEEIDKLEKEQEEHEGKKKDLDEKIAGIEQEMEGLSQQGPGEGEDPAEKREENKNVEVVRSMSYAPVVSYAPIRRTQENPLGLTPEQTREFYSRAEVREFIEEVVNLPGKPVRMKANQRGVNNSELGIPLVMMGFIRDSIEDYSLLLSRVNLRRIRGDGKAVIAGEIPEAVWTECCHRINELDIDFSDMYVYCHKVAGYIPVCNATLEDFGGQDGIPTLGNEIIYNLLKAIGLAVDKAIPYGDGIHMPLGFVHSLTLDENPIDSTQEWEKHTDNIGSTSKKGVEFFQDIMRFAAGIKPHNSTREITWIMSRETWLKYIAPESLTFNAAGTLVAAQNNSFPILGGSIVFLPFIPDGDVIGGYLDNYLLAERAGISVAMSEHYFFLDEHTVYKASARYDGAPITPFRDSFFAFNVNGGTPATTISFAPNTAENSPLLRPGGEPDTGSGADSLNYPEV